MKSDRLGLIMIAASLAVIGAIVALLYSKQSALHRDQVRVQGVALARALSGAQLRQLVPAAGEKSLVTSLASVQTSDAFAYAAVVSKTGDKLFEFAAAGSIVPPASMPTEPASWFGEHRLASPGDGKEIREFFAPVLQAGELAGFVRLGYDDSLQAARILEISYMALMALPVLLLMAFSYFLIRREMRPLANFTKKLEQAAKPYGLQLGFSGQIEVRQLAHRFDEFMQRVLARVHDLDQQSIEAQTASRLLFYKHEKAQAIIDAIPDAVLVTDDAGVLTYVNPMAGMLLGFKPDELVGKPLDQWCTRPEMLGLLKGFGDPVSSAYGAVVEYSPDNDPERRISVAAYPLFSPRDRSIVYGMLVVARNVSEQHVARQAGVEFVAQVSHELKTPLTTIATFSELLLDFGNLSPEERVEAVNGIHGEVRRAAALIANLLNVIKLEAGTLPLDRQRVKLHDLLREVAQGQGKAAQGKQVGLELKIAPDLGSARLDKELFRIAIDNLVGNAIKYSRPGGRVVLGAERLAGGEMKISVTDDGIGISAEDGEKIFDKYYRSSSKEVAACGGHGLGLYLAKRIVELHGGTLGVSSELGKGSEFSIEFEAATAPLEAAAG
jgi:signal transduction histidine kinase